MVVFLLAGCGQGRDAATPASSSTSASNSTPTPSPASLPTSAPSLAPPTAPAPTPTAAMASSPMPQPPTPAVMLLVGAASYPLGSTISVTITNRGGQTISFSDHQTNCTVLRVERQVGNAWQMVAPCRSMIKTRLLFLAGGGAMPVQLSTSPPWVAGLYRARLDYSLGLEAAPGPLQIVYSSQFRVN